MNITPKDLLDAGVHFGHQLRRWNPRSKPFIYDHRHGVSIIDLERTYQQLEKACAFLEDIVSRGHNVLFVGTKKQAQEIVREAAVSVQMPFCVSRWMGGTLTNFATIKTSLAKFRRFKTMESDGSLDKLENKEAAAIRRQMVRMTRNFEGIQELSSAPAALFVIDIKNEDIAVREAKVLGIPVVALVDTNSDPTLVEYPIPGNDDAVKSIRLIVEVVTEAIQNGLSQREASRVQKAIPTRVREQVFADQTEEGPEVTLPAGYEEDDSGKEASKPEPRNKKKAVEKIAPPESEGSETASE
jgi:small subunit ribosomal protein S2